MVTSESVTYVVPTWALSYLFNGDLSGYTDEQEADTTQFEQDCIEYAKQQGASHCHFTGDDSEPYFSPCNDVTGFIGDNVEGVELVLMFNK